MSAKSEVDKYIQELKVRRDEARLKGNHKLAENYSIKINTANKVKSLYEQHFTFDDFMGSDNREEVYNGN